MKLWLAFMLGLSTPFVDLRNAMTRASKMLDNLCWCWIVSVAMRYCVYAGVASVIGFVVWRNS